MDSHKLQAAINLLREYATPEKLQKMEAVLANRTRQVTVVMEDIFQSHNANAVIRSVECFGVQDIHLIEQQFTFRVSAGVAMGSTKWVDIHKHASTADAFAVLKAQGYKIVATTLHSQAKPLEELNLDHKLALVFGTENVGLSSYAHEHADAFVTIPMVGFTQSFNVSVSVALCLYHITRQLRSSSIAWQLTPQEKQELLLSWLRRTVRASKQLEERFLKE
jgi:tRNA (guanosine-2'-O-)-methyltransferase